MLNNLKQIGLALHGFESQNKTFPPGTKARYRFSYGYPTDNGVVTGGYEWTCYLHFILPYLEQQSYYDALGGPQFDLANPWVLASWANIPINSMSAFLCPSDGLGGNVTLVTCVLAASVPKSNYLGIFSGVQDGDNYSSRMYTNPVTTVRAVFRPYEGTPIADITDGTSNTMAVAEYLKGIDEMDTRGAYLDQSGRSASFSTLGWAPIRLHKTTSDSIFLSNQRQSQRSEQQPALYAAATMPTTPAPAAGIRAA